MDQSHCRMQRITILVYTAKSSLTAARPLNGPKLQSNFSPIVHVWMSQCCAPTGTHHDISYDIS